MGQGLITIAALIAVYLIWGSTYLATHYALQSFSPMIMVGIRFFLSGFILLLIAWATKQPKSTLPKIRNAVLTGIFMMFGGTGLVTIAQQSIDSSFAAVAIAAVPFWACVFSWFWGQRSNKYEWAGILIGLVGIVLLNIPKLNGSLLGLILLLIAPINWAFGSILGKKIGLPDNLFITSAVQQISGGLFALIFGLFMGQRVSVQALSVHSVLALVFLIVFGGSIAFSAYAYLLKHTRPALATSYAYVNPVVAMLLGALIVYEKITSSLVIALVIILFGVGLVVYGQGRETKVA